VKSETPLPGNRGVRVSTQMLRQGGDPIPVDYLLRNVNGQWKVFDVMVEGISYVQTFKNQFDAPLRQPGRRRPARRPHRKKAK
jgi:phospholipid transport system substrate-binding protein